MVSNGGFEPDDCNMPAWNVNDICPPWSVSEKYGYWQELLTTVYGPCSSETSGFNISPRTGKGAIGFPVYGWPASTNIPHESRGYIISPLTQKLQKGTVYQISYWVHAGYNGNGIERGTNAPGVLFTSDTALLQPNALYVLESNDAIYPEVPITNYQDWTQVCLHYTARGNEKFVILGNFRSNNNTPTVFLNPSNPPTETTWRWSYYVVDDLSILPYKEHENVIPSSAVICPNSEIEIQIYPSTIGVWDDGTTGQSRIITEPGEYYFSYKDGACTRYDFIKVRQTNCEKCYFYLPNAFTPNGDQLNDIWKPEFECDLEDYYLDIFDRLGNNVFTTFNPNEYWDPGSSVPEGVFLVRVKATYENHGEMEYIEESGWITVLH